MSSAAYYNACNHAHEVHAGVGSTTEYGLTLHTTASRTLYQFLGDPEVSPATAGGRFGSVTSIATRAQRNWGPASYRHPVF